MKAPVLLSRDAFREGTFARDGGKCVFCAAPAADAHHIIERRLWPDGGYYIENGASVCNDDHLKCEMTLYTVEQVREACGIKTVIVPPHLYADQAYDKWGNPVLANGTRLRGELFYDESVQKVLEQGGVLDLFTHWVKYPRTHHMPWSPGMNEDDRRIDSMTRFEGKRVILTEKYDGECTSMYSDHFHARSVDSRNHPSRSWAKAFWASIAANIPDRWRVCGENMYAQHSIAYPNLETYFYGYSIWDDKNNCLDWDETLEWFELLGITPVPVVYDDLYDEKKIRDICDSMNWETQEGGVLRLASGFSYSEFQHSIVKFVRQGHVQTNKHWMQGQRVIPNGLQMRKRPSFK